ncbi:hypothetical protein CLOP_g4322 [Closterium sp. NIES-67]|nr:hypothetical protein CLOP_g4322 [Closterium sp. NIES-67]
MAKFLSRTSAALLLAIALLSQLPTSTSAIQVFELVAALAPKDVQESLVARLFALDGTKDISGVTILIPRSDPLSTAPYGYASLDNSTRKYNQALYDALKLMYRAGSSSEGEWSTALLNVSAIVAGTLSDIWKFQIVKQYIPFGVATQKYSNGGPWELPALEGQPLWLSYGPQYGGTWNVTGISPQQQASTLQPKSSSGYPIFQGTPFAYSSLDAGDLVLDIPSGEVAVYKSDAVLLPYNMDALAAYAGATTSIFKLLALVGLALCALLLV